MCIIAKLLASYIKYIRLHTELIHALALLRSVYKMNECRYILMNASAFIHHCITNKLNDDIIFEIWTGVKLKNKYFSLFDNVLKKVSERDCLSFLSLPKMNMSPIFSRWRHLTVGKQNKESAKK